ncbi:MAG: hypothetical protein AVDCRST_MAG30-715 [uncultured Solirubrobacteraceae bacterium]|uniref:Uncharacterized protein n=1 Tax=uncultured Solirubrobacteraceae bacterium TaxID=1162706 RepID=A0A6J4RUT7_9ACTN|nr:MAG: hypothetical protein AVDCRST_MAG30-715 [uncultured Solirubrobacteraceae bacterium]
MPLDESPKLVSMMVAIEHAVIAELYRRLAARGFDGLTPASTAIFQFVRPGGSPVAELARLAHQTPAAIEEQVDALARAGYVRVEGSERRVALSDRGLAAAAVGLEAIDEIEAGWRKRLGGDGFSSLASGIAQLNLDPVARPGQR